MRGERRHKSHNARMSASATAQEKCIVVRQPTLSQRFAAEILGTTLLVFIGGGSATSATLLLHQTHLLPATTDLLLVALGHGLALFIVVMIAGKISGAHVNPAVTLGLAVIGRFPWNEVAVYLAGQVIGAVIGAGTIFVVFGRAAATIGHLGAPALAANTSLGQGLVIEALGAAILVITVVAAAVDTRAPAGWAALAIGLALAAILIFISPAAGPSVNPARSFGPYFVDLFFGVRLDWAAYAVAYLFGPLLGGIAGATLYAAIAHVPRLNA